MGPNRDPKGWGHGSPKTNVGAIWRSRCLTCRLISTGGRKWRQTVTFQDLRPVIVVHFAHCTGDTTQAIPYHVVQPMAWEYPYQYGQAQKALRDRLVLTSLYGLMVVMSGHQSAFHFSATAKPCAAGETYRRQISDSDVDLRAKPVGEAVGIQIIPDVQHQSAPRWGTWVSIYPAWNSRRSTGTFPMW